MAEVFPVVRSLADYYDPARFSYRADWTLGEAGTWQLQELATGRRFILKQCLPGDHDAAHEILVSRLLRRVLDRPVPDARFAVPGRRDAVLIRHAEALPYVGQELGHGHKLLGDYLLWNPERVDRLTARLRQPLDPLRFLLADFMTDQTDRHERNWLVATDAVHTDRWQLLLIDHAFSFTNLPADSQLHDPHPGRAAFTDLHLSALQQRRLSPAQIRAEYRRTLAAWRRAAQMTDLRWLDPDHAVLVKDTLATRTAHLAAHEARYLTPLTDPGQRELFRTTARDRRSELLAGFPSRSDPASIWHELGLSEPPGPGRSGDGPGQPPSPDRPGSAPKGPSFPRVRRRLRQPGSRDGLER